jgi:hypothetical protein
MRKAGYQIDILQCLAIGKIEGIAQPGDHAIISKRSGDIRLA